MMEIDKQIVYSFSDIIKLYKEYYLPTVAEEFPATIRIKSMIINYCKKFNLIYFEDNDEISLPKDSYDKIYKLIENRYLFFNKSIELYSRKETEKILNLNRTTIRKIVKEGHFNIATIIVNTIYFKKEDVDAVYNYLNKSYDINEATEIIRQRTKHKKVINETVRDIANNLNITFDNIYFKKSKRIMKNNIDELINYFKEKYYPHERKSDISWLEKYIKVKYSIIEQNMNHNLVGQEELKKFYYKHTSKKKESKDTQFMKTLIGIFNKSEINFFMNKSKNYFYISNDDYEKFKIYIQENILNIDKIDNYYSFDEIRTILEKDYIYEIVKDLPKVALERKIYIEKKEIDKLVELKQRLIEVSELCEYLDVDVETLYRILRRFNISYEDTKHLFTGKAINRKYIKDLEEYITYKDEINKANNRYEKYQVEISRITKNSKVHKTYNYYEEYVLKRLKENNNNQIVSALVNIHKDILSRLKKEIIYYNDKELEGIIYKIGAKQVKNEFINFLNYCKKYNSIFAGTYLRDRNEYEGYEAYTEDQWIRFGQILFVKDLPYYKISVEKAVENRNCAMVWLYCALNYICAWRKEDIINIQFPDIEILGISRDRYLKIVLEDKFTEEMAQKIVNNVINKINTLGVTPNKTKKNNKQVLKLVVCNSYAYTIGLLLYICEVHRRYYKPDKRLERERLITSSIPNKKSEHIKFFGEEYLKIFNGKCFSNMRSTKTISNYTQKISQQKGWGEGYYLVAIQRGHKFNKRGIPETTQVYLESFNKDKDIDMITRGLFERGTFGFISYQLVKMLDNKNVVNKKIDEQNMIIKEVVKFKSTDVERIIKNHYKFKYEVLNNIIDKSISKEIKFIDILKQISNGKASSKMSYCQCLLKTIKEDCCFKDKEECIGCNYLIPEMYFLMEFDNKINIHLEKMNKATLDYDKRRLSYVLINNYIPVLNEAIQYLGREKTCTFINIEKIKKNINNLADKEKLYFE